MERNPKLKVLLAHAGGTWHTTGREWTMCMARVLTAARSSNANLPLIWKGFYFDTITFDPGMLRNMIDRFGPDHVMLGTDYPYDMAEVDPLGLISAVKRLPKSDRDLITGGNAKKLFKLK
jgi:aminocarboxymuconate-semialdehyde decarboxylase